MHEPDPDFEELPPGIDDLIADLAEDAERFGFDLVAHTTVAAYHRALGLGDDNNAFRLPDYLSPKIIDGTQRSRAVVLIGNSKALWPPFMAALADDPRRRADQHPLDRWTSEVLSRIVVMVVGPHYAFDVRFAFEGGVRAFSALHLAEAAGLAWRGPAGLAVHPTLGPWFALRAAVVIDLPGREAAAPDPLCERCALKPCTDALAKAMAERDRGDVAHAAIRGDGVGKWRDWVAVRDACPVGTDHRYGEAQLRWHYAHDRSALG